jgi:hypothetical protein
MRAARLHPLEAINDPEVASEARGRVAVTGTR